MGRSSKARTTGALAPTIVLVRPQLGDNIGMAARAMLNCGLSSLRLVSPRDGWPNPKAQRAASGADVVLDKATLFDTVPAAGADLCPPLPTPPPPPHPPPPISTTPP